MPAAPAEPPPPAMARTSPSVSIAAELPQVALPLGGLGAGHLSVNSYGGLQDFAIRHQPRFRLCPMGGCLREAAFGLLHIRGRNSVTRLVEGPLPALAHL